MAWASCFCGTSSKACDGLHVLKTTSHQAKEDLHTLEKRGSFQHSSSARGARATPSLLPGSGARAAPTLLPGSGASGLFKSLSLGSGRSPVALIAHQGEEEAGAGPDEEAQLVAKIRSPTSCGGGGGGGGAPDPALLSKLSSSKVMAPWIDAALTLERTSHLQRRKSALISWEEGTSGHAGSSYMYNHSGHIIGLDGTGFLDDTGGPCGSSGGLMLDMIARTSAGDKGSSGGREVSPAALTCQHLSDASLSRSPKSMLHQAFSSNGTALTGHGFSNSTLLTVAGTSCSGATGGAGASCQLICSGGTGGGSGGGASSASLLYAAGGDCSGPLPDVASKPSASLLPIDLHLHTISEASAGSSLEASTAAAGSTKSVLATAYDAAVTAGAAVTAAATAAAAAVGDRVVVEEGKGRVGCSAPAAEANPTPNPFAVCQPVALERPSPGGRSPSDRNSRSSRSSPLPPVATLPALPSGTKFTPPPVVLPTSPESPGLFPSPRNDAARSSLTSALTSFFRPSLTNQGTRMSPAQTRSTRGQGSGLTSPMGHLPSPYNDPLTPPAPHAPASPSARRASALGAPPPHTTSPSALAAILGRRSVHGPDPVASFTTPPSPSASAFFLSRRSGRAADPTTPPLSPPISVNHRRRSVTSQGGDATSLSASVAGLVGRRRSVGVTAVAIPAPQPPCGPWDILDGLPLSCSPTPPRNPELAAAIFQSLAKQGYRVTPTSPLAIQQVV